MGCKKDKVTQFKTFHPLKMWLTQQKDQPPPLVDNHHFLNQICMDRGKLVNQSVSLFYLGNHLCKNRVVIWLLVRREFYHRYKCHNVNLIINSDYNSLHYTWPCWTDWHVIFLWADLSDIPLPACVLNMPRVYANIPCIQTSVYHCSSCPG